jgi:glycosyltransferase involved in cell wall biosynthesis
MKLAVIDHILNPGGGVRVARSLLPAMKKVRPDLQITFFANEHGIRRDSLEKVLEQSGIRVVSLRAVKYSGRDLFGLRGSRHVVGIVQRKLGKLGALLPVAFSGALQKELENEIQGFDFAFFTWPFHLHCPRLKCPMAGIFHDYNYRYYFSANPMLPSIEAFLNETMPVWLAQSTPIVSTEFMRSEIGKFYPDYADKVRVVPIAPMSRLSQMDSVEARHTVVKMGVSGRYLLCPTQMMGHKNVGPLLAAHALLKKRGYPGILVFTGAGTDSINGRACDIGLERGKEGRDVFGLGYVSNEQVDALIRCADVVVNSSLYEGGNGPGFDAWSLGVPVAMSHIPPFLEHMKTHDVRAEIFDPRSPEDIADKIGRILSNPLKSLEDAAHSREAISAFTWERSAQGYLDVFEETISRV